MGQALESRQHVRKRDAIHAEVIGIATAAAGGADVVQEAGRAVVMVVDTGAVVVDAGADRTPQ